MDTDQEEINKDVDNEQVVDSSYNKRSELITSCNMALLSTAFRVNPDIYMVWDFSRYIKFMLNMEKLYSKIFVRYVENRAVSGYFKTPDYFQFSNVMRLIDHTKNDYPFLKFEDKDKKICKQYMYGETNNISESALAQFVVSCMCSKDQILYSRVRKGLAVWYAYCLWYKFPTEEDWLRLIECNAFDKIHAGEQYIDGFVFEMLSKDELVEKHGKGVFNSILTSFSIRHPKKPTPKVFMKVKFEEVIGLVSMRTCILIDGYAYIAYADGLEWMMTRWENKTKINSKLWSVLYKDMWRRHSRHMEHKWKLDMEHANSSGMPKIKRKCRERIKNQRMIKMEKFEKTIVRRYPIAPRSLCSLSQFQLLENLSKKTVEWWESKRNNNFSQIKMHSDKGEIEFLNTLPKKYKRKSLFESSDSNDSASSEDEELDPFLADYSHMLAPCIRKILNTHFAEKSHMKNEARKHVFMYMCAVNIPESAVSKMWYRMCRASVYLEESYKATLFTNGYASFVNSTMGIHVKSLMDTKREHIKRSGQNNFASCVTTRNKRFTRGNGSHYNACVVNDIEDLGNAKMECWKMEMTNMGYGGELLYMKFPRYWSPKVSFNHKIYVDKKLNQES